MGNKTFTADDKMYSLIAANYTLVQVMTRFGIKVGFGDRTVDEVCTEAGVDCATFLAVVNFVQRGFQFSAEDTRPVSVKSLMHYLKQSHVYFLDYALPSIRKKLIEGIPMRADDVSFLIMKFFDEYYAEVKKHMEYEELTVFKHIESLLDGVAEDFQITTYSDHHEEVSTKLGELKGIIVKFCPENADPNLLNDALYDIFSCEQELHNHCLVEDHLLVPEIKRLERIARAKAVNAVTTDEDEEQEEEETADVDPQAPLSQREKEIVACVAKGMANKEIAEKLFISPHTVITHRRNIARKLDIHSAQGFTIYAIVNKIVDISEIKV